jgi:hypothetical protein
MVHGIWAVFGVLGFLLAFSQEVSPDSIDLGGYQWENRLLLIFAPSAEEPDYRALLEQIRAQESGIRERDVIVFQVLARGESRKGEASITKGAGDALRDRFNVKPNQFTVILVGKDGGEKLRRTSALDLRDVFGLIDSMPMRQEEMKGRPRK